MVTLKDWTWSGRGNEHVVRGRFADANFFVREDLKHKLEDLRPPGTLMFQKKLGSMLDKNERIEKLTGKLAPMLGLEADQAVFARRAAHCLKPTWFPGWWLR